MPPRSDYGAGMSFKVAFLVSFSLLFIGLSLMIWIAVTFPHDLTPGQINLSNAADSLFKGSLGMIIGLVSGKSLS